MRQASVLLCVLVLLSCVSIFVPQPNFAASVSAVWHSTDAIGNESGQGKSTPDFVLRDPDLSARNAGSSVEPDNECSNCLIRLCRVGSNNKLTGYCIEGARGGICHQDYNPSHCPPGATPKKLVLSQQCGFSGRFLVDALRTCT